MNAEKLRKDFPILEKKFNKNPLIYFDNSCMTLRPTQVIDAMNEYYTDFPGCALRSQHKISKLATEKVEESRRIIQKFVGAKKPSEIIFTRNTTESINLVANSFGLKKGDIVLTTDKEHNSNNIPWQALSKKSGIIKKITRSNQDNTFSLENFEKMMNKDVKLVSVVHTSNMDGVTTPIKEISKIAHDFGAKILLDGAQSVPHKEIDARKLDIDFLAFSGHKMLGPSGMGVLYGKEALLSSMSQFIVGGETVIDSTYDAFTPEELPAKFEAGLSDYAGIIGLGAAAKYVESVGRENISKHETMLNKRLTDAASSISGLEILGPKNPELRGGIFSFNIKGIDHHEIALLSDSMSNVALRSGAHCVHAWFNEHKLPGSVRASMYLYNTEQEVDVFAKTLKEISKLR